MSTMTDDQDIYLHMIGAMRFAASSCRMSATNMAERASQVQNIVNGERAEATYMLELAGRWDRVTDGVEQGVIALDDVIVSLEYAEERLAARTPELDADPENDDEDVAVPGDRVRVTADGDHRDDDGTLIAVGPVVCEVLLDKDRGLGSGGVRYFAPEELLWLKPDDAGQTDPAVEAFVDVADAEHYAHRDEYVNAPDFKPGDLVNVCEPGHKHFGVRGSIIGFVYDPDGVVVEYDNLGNTFTVPASSLMHHTDFVKQPQEYSDEAEAIAVREIKREMAIEAGDDSEIDRQVAEDDARFERAMWLAQGEAESEAAQEKWIAQREAAVDEVLDARDAESEA